MFPSPFGAMFLKVNINEHPYIGNESLGFPSPCEAMFLKELIEAF